MDLSFFIQPLHPIDRTYGDILREDMDAIILADKLGYKEAFIGEHFTDLAEPITSSLMFIARLISETKTIKLGSGIVNLPVYHPVMVAGHVAMIDQMLEGRFIWGIGPGGQPSDMEAFGNLEIDRNAKMIESFEQIMELWWGEPPFDVKGEFFSFTTQKTHLPEIGQGLVPKPWHNPHPPVVVTAMAPYSHGITMAAERDWNPISCQYVQAHWVKTHLPKYLEGLKNAGKPEDPAGWRVAKCIFVADDEATANSYARSESGPYGFYFSNLMKKLGRGGKLGLFGTHPDQPKNEITLQQSLDTQVIAGTVDSVVEQILAFREEIGPFGTLVYTGLDWVNPELGRHSMVLMAEEVMPCVNTALKGKSI
ncbi:MAG: LLM class flavin-dependent oxidoreductase [Rhodospirillales bacterium]|jgi:alkanesulfonate monooxygenase SsuD/methylene tetrahydromethanopterin reductase-like flavin-dependent oxidoreductase (luciferase family)